MQQERLEERMRRLRASRGPSHDATLKATFKLLDCLIGQYKLNMTDRVLSEVKTVCKERGSDWYVKWIQSLAFCRWKQHPNPSPNPSPNPNPNPNPSPNPDPNPNPNPNTLTP